MISKEDYFYAFFSGIISFIIGFLLVFLVAPGYFQKDPSIFAVSLIVILEVVVFLGLFMLMRRRGG